MNARTYALGSRVLLGALLAAATSCIDPFNPKVAESNKDYLVVDGFINTRGVTTIKLSHTLSLDSKSQPPAERQARAYVEDDRGQQYPLTESTAGSYTSAALTLDAARQYRVHLFTRAGREYASDFVQAKVTPAIDSVTWQTDARGLTFQANTHDDDRRSRYYRWSYDETWQFTSAFHSIYQFINGQLALRGEDIHHCWASANSTTIRVANSARLSQDRIADFPLVTLPPTSPKLGIKYSIRVRQYALTQEEYQYWEMLQKNTEQLGGVFDALPSQLTGNVHCLSDANAEALGFVGACSETEKRIFVERTALPRDWRMLDPYSNCLLDTIAADEAVVYFSNPTRIVINIAGGKFLGASADCADCRLKGTNVRPAYWQ